MQPFTFFISYRRQDTAPIALLLKSEIEKVFRFARVAVDVEEMRAGDSFPERLRGLIDNAHATLVLIGRHWMPPAGAPAPAAPDWVVTEIEHSRTAPLAMAEGDRCGLVGREILPLFVDCERGFDRFELPPAIDFLRQLHAEHIDHAGWPAAIGPLLLRIAAKLPVQLRSDAVRHPVPDPAKARTQALPDAELDRILHYDAYAGWYVDNFGRAEERYLAKDFEFDNFHQAAAFMTMVAAHCEIMEHYPEWRHVNKQVTVSLTTWDARHRVTIHDLNVALYMNMAAKAIAKGAR
jgi:pterin-4a-carbinolamine dehydratase